MSFFRGLVVAAVLSWILAGSAGAQRTMVAGGATVQAYRFGDAASAGVREVGLHAFPFVASVQLASWLGIEAAGGWARGALIAPDGRRAELRGLGATEVALAVGLAGGRLRLRAVTSVPSAAATQSAGEARVAGVMAAGFLPLTITEWAAEGGVGADLGFALEGGPVDVAGEAGYRVHREAEPLEGAALVYRPGDEARARLRVRGRVGPAASLEAELAVRWFRDDRMAGKSVLRAGPRLHAALAYAFPVAGRASARVHVGLLMRSEGTPLLEDVLLPQLASAPSRQIVTVGTDARVAWSRLAVVPRADIRLLRSGDATCYRGIGADPPRVCPSAQGWIASAGATAELRLAGGRLSPSLVLAPGAAMRTGRLVVAEGLESTVRGWEAGLTVRIAR